MCGRFVRKRISTDYAAHFGVPLPEMAPSYNVAPSQPVLTIRDRGGQREGAILSWGLTPYWSRDGKVFINARAETIAEKPSFRDAFRRRRCLVVGDGYYEWHPEHGGKQPYYFKLRDDEPLAFAGIWDAWNGPDGVIESCAIIVTEANELSRPIHDRMPVILSRESRERWLDHSDWDAALLKALLVPYADGKLETYPVSRAVNNPRNDRPELIVPLLA